MDLGRLVQFLEELVQGKKPFVAPSLDIKRRPAGDSLDVELEVSSLRRKKSPGCFASFRPSRSLLLLTVVAGAWLCRGIVALLIVDRLEEQQEPPAFRFR